MGNVCSSGGKKSDPDELSTNNKNDNQPPSHHTTTSKNPLVGIGASAQGGNTEITQERWATKVHHSRAKTNKEEHERNDRKRTAAEHKKKKKFRSILHDADYTTWADDRKRSSASLTLQRRGGDWSLTQHQNANSCDDAFVLDRKNNTRKRGAPSPKHRRESTFRRHRRAHSLSSASTPTTTTPILRRKETSSPSSASTTSDGRVVGVSRISTTALDTFRMPVSPTYLEDRAHSDLSASRSGQGTTNDSAQHLRFHCMTTVSTPSSSPPRSAFEESGLVPPANSDSGAPAGLTAFAPFCGRVQARDTTQTDNDHQHHFESIVASNGSTVEQEFLLGSNNTLSFTTTNTQGPVKPPSRDEGLTIQCHSKSQELVEHNFNIESLGSRNTRTSLLLGNTIATIGSNTFSEDSCSTPSTLLSSSNQSQLLVFNVVPFGHDQHDDKRGSGLQLCVTSLDDDEEDLEVLELGGGVSSKLASPNRASPGCMSLVSAASGCSSSSGGAPIFMGKSVSPRHQHPHHHGHLTQHPNHRRVEARLTPHGKDSHRTARDALAEAAAANVVIK